MSQNRRITSEDDYNSDNADNSLGISSVDRSLILSVRSQLEASGVLSRASETVGTHDAGEIYDMLQDAADNAVSEEQINKNHYSPEAIQALYDSEKTTTRNDLMDDESAEHTWETGPKTSDGLDLNLSDFDY